MPYLQLGFKRRVFQLEWTSAILDQAEESEIVDVSSEHELGFRKHEDPEDKR
jgi:hypothetical protein